MAWRTLRRVERHVVLCGLEGLGLRTLEELDRLGEKVVVIAEGAEHRFLEPARLIAVRVVNGSYRDPGVLLEAGVGSARAIVFTADDDIGNLDGALAASELAPGLRIVIRIFEAEFGRRIETLFGDCTALGASRLAAPGFVASALHEDAERPVEIAERRFVVRAAEIGAPEVVMPLARLAEDGTLSPFPTDADGSRALCLTEPTDAERAAPLPDHGVHHHLQAGADTATGIVSILMGADRRLRYIAVVLVGLMIVASLVFSAFAQLDIIDGIFNTTKAFFGGVDESVAKTDALKIFSIVLTLLGALTIAILFTLMADAVLTARLSHVLEANPRRMRGHVVVCGLGTIGYRIVELLRELDHEVVVAELRADARFVEPARRLGARVIIADVRTIEALEALNVEEARCLIVATSSDLANLETAVHARTLAPKLRIVVRLFDPQLAARMEKAFGSYVSRSTSTLAAPAFAAAAVGRQILLSIPVGPRVLVVARLPVEAGSPADGSTVGAEEAEVEARVLALERGSGRTWEPAGAMTMAAGDRLLVVATRRGIAEAVRRTQPMAAAPAVAAVAVASDHG
jgi:Trk K+ transport system NAD-binding subunit